MLKVNTKVEWIHSSSNSNREKKADRDQSPFSKVKQSSQDNELKFPTLKNKEDEKTRSSVEKENQKSKGQENDHTHDKNKKFDHESSPGTDEDKSGWVSYINFLCPFCLRF